MEHLKAVMARREAIEKHYQRGGLGETAPDPICPCCADEGYVAQYYPTWTPVEGSGGYIEASVGWVECPQCPLALEMMNAAAVEAAAS